MSVVDPRFQDKGRPLWRLVVQLKAAYPRPPEKVRVRLEYEGLRGLDAGYASPSINRRLTSRTTREDASVPLDG